MRQVLIFTALLVAGLVLSQILPSVLGDGYGAFAHGVKVLTMLGLAFIMIHVGYEFDIDKRRLRQYGWDYIVAATAAAFPWIFCALYFVYILMPSEAWNDWDTWKASLLASRFAAPTSAGVLFAMLAAAGLGMTWMFRKARILAIFDDLDTVLLMIPLKIMIVGMRWQLWLVVVIMVIQLWLAWRFLHRLRIPITWPWVLGYAALITGACEAVYYLSKLMDEVVTIHIEVLLPAFVLGAMIAGSGHAEEGMPETYHDEVLDRPQEKRAIAIVSACFMVLVGLSMPPIAGLAGVPETVAGADDASVRAYVVDNGADPILKTLPDTSAAEMGWSTILLHVLLITLLSNIGKMFPALCYRREAHWRERLAVAVALFPRGEVGAGVLVISLSYGIGGPMITVAMLSLALNLMLTGLFILVVRKLLAAVPPR